MRTGHSTRRARTVALVAALALVVITACADAAGPNSGLTDDRDDASVTTEANTTDPPTTAATTTTTVPPTTTTTVQVVDSGTYVVPDQFAPGTYRVDGYWARLDADQNIIDNDIVDDGLTLVNVADTDAYVEISGSAVALGDMPQVDPLAEGWTDGTYLVGVDIPAGRYNISADGTSAYYARLGANRDIIDNNISDGNVIAVVQDSDWALTYTGTIGAMP
jgi:hypothetical protein